MLHDFMIIGAGMAGASLAYELAATGKVCLIEGEERPGVHSTGRSAALFAPTYGGSEIRAITRASRAFFNAPPPGFSEDPLLIDRGCLYIARADQVEDFQAMTQSIRASGGTISPITVAEARMRIPLLREDYLAQVAVDFDAADIDVDALHQGFLRGSKARGAKIVTHAAVSGAAFQDGLWSIELPGGEIARAPVVINAAGAWADQIATLCGAAPRGLQPLLRTALLIDPPEGVDIRHWPAVIDTNEEFYFKPDAGKLLLSPADETPVEAGDAQPEELDIAIAVDRVQQALDIEVRRVSHSWAGLRTFAPDRVPIIGYDADRPGLFWCAGQGGYGIQTAPAMARLAASLVRREAVPPDIAAEGIDADALSPSRLEPVV